MLAEQQQVWKEQLSAEEFIGGLQKIHRLLGSQMVTEAEYTSKKSQQIATLQKRKIRGDFMDFLLELVPLKEQGVLTVADVAKIKTLLEAKG